MYAKINAVKKLKELRVKQGSRQHSDYETFKQWLQYQPVDESDYDQALKDAAKYLGI